ncbi:MAG TPA: type II secretion system F family protein [Deltaproteobacteria bacterium]|nr:type II secretion system F family protein [Deltaproteobacteria bacterium]
MANFEYSGRTATGERVRGQMEAASSSGVAAELTAKGIIPLKIGMAGRETPEFVEKFQRAWNRRRISLTDVIMFCRQMTSLIRAGVPITRGLRGLAETLRNPEFGRILLEMADDLEKGHEFASVLQRHPRIFSNLFVAIIHIGESSGRLEDAFEQLHGYLSLEDETRKRIKSALRYPTLVLISIVIAIAVINVFVVPPFANLFASFGAELPWATKILISSSQFTMEYWPIGVAIAVATWWVVRRWLATAEGRLAWHAIQLRIPQIGSILERALLARFCRTLAITLGSGLPVTQCLTIASRAVDNDHVAARIVELRGDIEAGDTLTAAAHASGLFTPLVLQMIAVGEETGAVEDTLAEVASYYEREVDYDLRKIGDAIEPIMIVFVGILVLGLALGVYLPMWEMASAARG